MKVNKTSGSTGVWLKKDEIRSGDKLKIVSEASLVEGQNGVQLVAKVRQRGSNDAFNTAINNTSKNALIDKYGDDTADWVDKVVTAITEKALIAGKRSIILYLVPEGYELKETEDGFMTILPADIQTAPVKKTTEPTLAGEDDRDIPEITKADIPF